MAECACASLILLLKFLSLVYMDPRYLNWSTSSSVFPFIHMLVDCLGLMPLTGILLLSEMIFTPYLTAVFSRILLHCLQADRCRRQTASCTDDSGMSVSSVSSTASPAKQSFRFLCYLFRNILNRTVEMGILVVLPLLFERNLRHFHWVTQRCSLHRIKTTWWLQSAGCRCCIL